jgi:hypothetical protein
MMRFRHLVSRPLQCHVGDCNFSAEVEYMAKPRFLNVTDGIIIRCH